MKAKVNAWLARDKMADLYIYNEKPHKSDYWPEWYSSEEKCFEIDSSLFPEIKWEDDEPTKVELTIKIK